MSAETAWRLQAARVRLKLVQAFAMVDGAADADKEAAVRELMGSAKAHYEDEPPKTDAGRESLRLATEWLSGYPPREWTKELGSKP